MRGYFRTLLAALIIGIDIVLLGIFLNLTGWFDSSSAASVSTPTPWPTVTPTSPVSPTPTPRTTQVYVVRPGDVLADIAKRFGSTVEDIQRSSGITDVNTIRAGQPVTIPVPPSQ